MEKSNFSKPMDEGLGSSIRKYLYMQVDRAALKGAETMSVISNRVIVTTILLLTGSIVLIMLCIAGVFFLGDGKLSGMKELNLKQQFVETEIRDKEEDIALEYQMLKKMLNPLHYIGLVVDKIRDIFHGKTDDENISDNDNYQANQF